MTTITASYIPAAQVTGLTGESVVGGVSLQWEETENGDTYEVWQSGAPNSVGYDAFYNATMLATVSANSYSVGNANGSYYYWVNAVTQYGGAGPISQINSTSYTYGSTFNSLYMYLQVGPLASSAITLSINNVKVNVYYTTSAGVATSTGLTSFTTTVVNNTHPSGAAWTNPDYSRGTGANYATISTSSTAFTDYLQFAVSDLGVPSTATVTGIIVQWDGKTTDSTHTGIIVKFGDNAFTYVVLNDTAPASGFTAPYTANNTLQTHTYGTTTDPWNLGNAGGLYLAGIKIDSTYTSSPTSIPSSALSTTTINGGTATVTAPNTPYTASYVTVSYPPATTFINVSQYINYSVTGISSTAGQVLQVWAQQYLYDATLSAVVPGTTIKQLLLSTNGTTTYGSTAGIVNFDNSFECGFRGLMIPTHGYSITVQIYYLQITSTPTCTINVIDMNSSSTVATLT